MICFYRCVLFYRTCLLIVQIRKQKKKEISKEFFDPFCDKFLFKIAFSFAGIRNLIEHVQNQTKEWAEQHLESIMQCLFLLESVSDYSLHNRMHIKYGSTQMVLR